MGKRQMKAIGRFLLPVTSGSLGERVVRGAVGSFALDGLMLVIGFLISLTLARFLGAAEYGGYAYTWAWVLVLGVLGTVGLDQLLVRQVAKYEATAAWDRLHGILRWANWVGVLASAVVVALFLLALEVFGGRFDPQILAALQTGIWLLPVIVLTRIRRATVHGLHSVVIGSIPEKLIQPVLMLIGAWIAFGVLGIDRRAASALWIALLASTLALAAAAGFLRIASRGIPASQEPRFESSVWLRSAVPLMLVSGMYLLSARVDTLMLGALRGAEVVGVYAIASRGAELVLFSLTAINVALAPAISRLYAKRDLGSLQRMVTNASRIGTVLALPVVAVFMAVPAFFLGLFGDEFSTGATVLVLLSLAQLVDVFCGPVGLLLIMSGFERDTGRVVAATTVMNVLLNALFIPAWGMTGAAMATGISIIVRNASLTFTVRRRLGLYSTALGRPSWRSEGDTTTAISTDDETS